MGKRNNLNKVLPMIISVVLTLGVGGLSNLIIQPAFANWYVALNKPFFTLPTWIFVPVWSLLYVLMGIAAARVWVFGRHHLWGKTALYHYGVQLLFNGLWSLVFFGLKAPKLALFVIIVLFVLIERSIHLFKLVDRKAAYLLYPYLAWIVYAGLLNGTVALNN